METGTVDAHLVALANCPVFGSRSLEKLLAHFSSSDIAWEASRDELLTLNIPDSRVDAFLEYRRKTVPTDLVAKLQASNITAVDRNHKNYPELLKTIYDPPVVLFVKGNPESLSRTSVAIVGSRYGTDYGIKNANTFAREIARAGIVVVSGLALGVDSAAHEGALETGTTIAILGCGILFNRSSDQRMLEEKIIGQSGAIVSEFPFDTPGHKFNFPIRNRLIAGMSKATLVVEAKLPSGSLITAKSALDNGRDVFALPGPITSIFSAGTNWLLKDGAHVATEPNDILSIIGVQQKDTVAIPAYVPANDLEKTILTILEKNEKHVDEIIKSCGTSTALVSQTLMLLEIKSVIQNIGGMRYKINR